MNKLTRFYNKNRKIIWSALFILVIIISVPKALDNYVIKQKELNQSSSNENITTTSGNKDYSIISGETVKKETNIQNNIIISNYIDYCNNKKVEEAYSLLSNNCKEKLYPSMQDFYNDYYNNVFSDKKIYDIQAWYTNNNCYTYKVDFKEDILSTGNTDVSSMEDYYTIVIENGENKLNINSYVQTEEINKQNEINEVKVTLLSKDIYMDYEIYNLVVETKTEKPIYLDSLENTNTMYLTDSEGLHYYAYNHELVKEELRVRGIKNVKIKFNKKYTTKRQLTSIMFSDIIPNSDNYILNGGYEDRKKLEINF